MKTTKLIAALLLTGLATGVAAQAGKDNLATLKQMKVSGVDLNIPPVPQEGRNAEAIKANLKNVKLPPGFKIELYAVVPDARHMAVAPSTNMLFVGTRKTRVWAVTDRNGDGSVDKQEYIDEYLQRFDLVITSYGTLSRDIAAFSLITWGAAICDEGQNIKNSRAQAAKAA